MQRARGDRVFAIAGKGTLHRGNAERNPNSSDSRWRFSLRQPPRRVRGKSLLWCFGVSFLARTNFVFSLAQGVVSELRKKCQLRTCHSGDKSNWPRGQSPDLTRHVSRRGDVGKVMGRVAARSSRSGDPATSHNARRCDKRLSVPTERDAKRPRGKARPDPDRRQTVRRRRTPRGVCRSVAAIARLPLAAGPSRRGLGRVFGEATIAEHKAHYAISGGAGGRGGEAGGGPRRRIMFCALCFAMELIASMGGPLSRDGSADVPDWPASATATI